MKKPPRKFPEKAPSIINDDAEAQEIMLELGVWDTVSKQGKSTSTISMCVADTHPTHWCLCARHFLNPDPNENGFQVITYPKKLVDPFTMQAIVAQFMSGGKDVTCQPFEYKNWE